MKTVIVVGAGSTLSDGLGRPAARRPPLDSGFFKVCKTLKASNYPNVREYLAKNYGLDPTISMNDSLEKIMAIIYADLTNPTLNPQAVNAFRNLIRLFNARIAETTNELPVTNRSNLYRIIAKLFRENVNPENLSIVTFNQDLHIEKTLERLSKTKAFQKLGDIFSFPACYQLPKENIKGSTPPAGVEKFTVTTSTLGIPIYKLHGSLNWFSTHTSYNVPISAILNSKKGFRITPRRNINADMTFNAGKRKVHTFPLITPPVNHKAAIIHKNLHPVWRDAEAKLRDASRIIILGYSCPNTDFESANLFRRVTNSGTPPKSFEVIDPNPLVFQRYLEVTNLNHLSFFKNADAFIKKK